MQRQPFLPHATALLRQAHTLNESHPKNHKHVLTLISYNSALSHIFKHSHPNALLKETPSQTVPVH